MYDTSVKVPMLVSRPGHTPAGMVCDDLLSHYDLMPTLLDYAGIDLADADQLPGRSFAPLLQEQPLPPRERVVVFDEYGPVRMIRAREWKYVHRYPYGPNELYDLVNDPDEEHNLAGDAGHRSRMEALRGEMQDWFQQYADPRVDGTREPVTGKGQIDLAGVENNGRPAYDEEWWCIDAGGARR